MKKEKSLGNKKSLNIQEWSMIFFLMMLLTFFSIFGNGFLTWDNIINVFRQVSVNGIIAVGAMMIIISGGLDLSCGSILGASAVIGATIMATLEIDPIIAIGVSMLVGAAIGGLNGLFITKLKINPLITTLGTMQSARGIAYIITKGISIYGFPKSFRVIGGGFVGPIPVPVIMLLVVFAIGYFILYKLPIGRYIYALGGSEESVKLSGVDPNKVKMFVYIFAGILSALAGIVYLSRVNSATATTGSGTEMDVITAVVLGGVSVSGGVGKLRGVFIGILLLGFLTNGMIIMGIADYYQYVVKGVVLLLAVALDQNVFTNK